MLLCSILFTTARLACSARTAPYTFQNTTVSVPQGTSNHGNPELLCVPSRWTDVAKFFTANILAHAATVRTSPGEPLIQGFLAMLGALLFPTSGVARGIDAIFRHAITGSSPVQQAKKAGALCEVVRIADWTPYSGDVIRRTRTMNPLDRQDLERATNLGLHTYLKNIYIPSPYRREVFKKCDKMFGLRGRKLHGLCCLPLGYGLSPVSSSSTVAEMDIELDVEGSDEVEVSPDKSPASELQPPKLFDISSSYSFSKGTIAILQILYASATLYNTRGDQIDRYGFTAFGLTVVPYLIMSIVNLTGTILTPTYPTAFLVESEIMDEARRRGGCFRGAVGRLALPKPAPQFFDAMFKVDSGGRMAISIIESNAGASHITETDEELPAVPPNLDSPSFITLPGIVVPWCNDCLDARTFRTYHLTLSFTAIIGMIPIAINAGLSRMESGKSTSRQQAWIAFWMFSGMIGAFTRTVAIFSEVLVEIKFYRLLGKWYWIIHAFTMAYCGICAGGTSVIVAQMILEYGHCVQIYGGI